MLSKIRGTIETLFRLGLGGPQLKKDIGNIDARDATDAAFVNVRGLDPLIDDDLTTKRYVDATVALPARTAATWFGQGTDGDVVLGPGTTVLTQDMSYNNLTIPTGSQLQTNGWRVFVKDTLDITGADAGSIFAIDNTNDGGDAVGAAFGPSSAAFSFGTIPSLQGGNGAAGGTGVGALGQMPLNPYADILFANGGQTGSSGAGGNGTPNAGGAVVGPFTALGRVGWPLLNSDLTVNSFGIAGGIPGSGGSAGGGDGTRSGGGGGGGGGGGWMLLVYANTITKAPATPAGVFVNNGGNGGHGGTTTIGNTGGGGGGSAGGGGWTIIAHATLIGPVIPGLLIANGGVGGTGGNGFGTGTGGNGGAGGDGGLITLQNITGGVIANVPDTAGSPGSPHIGLAGGAGGAGGTCSANL